MKTKTEGDAALVEALASLRREYDDLRVVSGADVDTSGFTLVAMVRNEMYFLPDFLAHYRALGVNRFVFLNDRSDDGSFEYMCKQPDAVVVESDRTYGDTVDIPPKLKAHFKNKSMRTMELWRPLLHDRFSQDRWTLQVDVDEFVHLPLGLTFPSLVTCLDKSPARAVWGVMLDVYPKDIGELTEQETAARVDMTATWYFDGEQHLRLRPFGKLPEITHAGARARLYQTYGIDRLYPALDVRARKIRRRGIGMLWRSSRWLRYNALQKPVLLKWQENGYASSHRTNLPVSMNYLLPIQHFRFSGDLHRRIITGLRERSYYRGSTDHRLLLELLKSMEARKGTFLYSKSRPLEGFDDFVRTRNALGL